MAGVNDAAGKQHTIYLALVVVAAAGAPVFHA